MIRATAGKMKNGRGEIGVNMLMNLQDIALCYQVVLTKVECSLLRIYYR